MQLTHARMLLPLVVVGAAATIRCVHAGPSESWFLLDAARAWALVRILLAFVEEVPEAAPHASLAAATHAAQVRAGSCMRRQPCALYVHCVCTVCALCVQACTVCALCVQACTVCALCVQACTVCALCVHCVCKLALCVHCVSKLGPSLSN